MRTHLTRLAIMSITVIACCSLSLSRADEDAAREYILRLAQGANPDDPTKFPTPRQAEEFAKTHSLASAARVAFKPKSKGGLGIARVTAAGHKDSIELLLRDYVIRPPTRDEVVKYDQDLLQVGRIILVMSAFVPQYAPKTDIGPNTAAEWRKYADEMKKGSREFLDAVEAKDERKLASAARRLNEACATCHKRFRDVN
jgi:hypothetical protein